MADSAQDGGVRSAPPGMAARLVDRAAGALAVAAGGLLLAITGLVTLDVLGRLPSRLADTWLLAKALPALLGPFNAQAYSFTLPWTTEITEYALYWMTFLGAPWVLREGGHISIDIVTQRLGPAARARLARIVAALGALISAVLLYYSIAVLRRSFAEGTLIVRILTVQEWWIFAPLPVSVLLLFAIFLRWLARPPAQHRARPEGL